MMKEESRVIFRAASDEKPRRVGGVLLAVVAEMGGGQPMALVAVVRR